MKTIIVLMILCVAVSAGAGERNPWWSGNCLYYEGGSLAGGSQECWGYTDEKGENAVTEGCRPCPQTIDVGKSGQVRSWVNKDHPADSELISILERAREFIEDNEVDYSLGVSYSVHYPLTAQSSADGKAHEAAEYAKKLKRETNLRKDIEAMIGRLK